MLTVASVPAGHVYVRHIDKRADSAVRRLPDPPPPAASSEQQWWPPVMLQPGWVDDNADSFDLFHIHFGFDALGPEDLREIVESLRRHGKPLVYTVHDLRNPHQPDRRAHDEALDILVPAADALVTLTSGGAEEIRSRWGREAHVIPHPHVVGPDDFSVARPTNDRPRIGLHLKSLRANMNPLPVLPVLAQQSAERGMDFVVDVHTDVVTAGMANHHPGVVEMLESLQQEFGTRIHVHDYYTDDELWDYFRGLDLSVLPYRFGTHSGWLEACFDLGTRVLAPRIGHYHDQHDGVLGYRLNGDDPVVEDISEALDRLQDGPTWRADRAERFEQRERIGAAHEQLYADLLKGNRQ